MQKRQCCCIPKHHLLCHSQWWNIPTNYQNSIMPASSSWSKMWSICIEYRSFLRALHNRWLKWKNQWPSTRIAPGSHTALCHLTTPERNARLSNVKARADAAERQVKRLQEKIQASTTRIGVTVGEEFHNELTKVMMERSKEIQQQYPENSFQHLFWEQQLQATQAKCCTQVRWHPCTYSLVMSAFEAAIFSSLSFFAVYRVHWGTLNELEYKFMHLQIESFFECTSLSLSPILLTTLTVPTNITSTSS